MFCDPHLEGMPKAPIVRNFRHVEILFPLKLPRKLLFISIYLEIYLFGEENTVEKTQGNSQ